MSPQNVSADHLPRRDLIEHLKRYVDEFNASHSKPQEVSGGNTPIVLYEVRDDARVRRERRALFQDHEEVEPVLSQKIGHAV